ncbi:MAG: hypothetical protein PHE21_03865, partial [Candidatus Dojkabacteria bacterium]|nr:hypothetical protein [Candidatus Dojkabacteria bacterium]
MKKEGESNFLDKDLGGAIFLIFLGILFLLITTGQIGWDIWIHILKFWPLFLISGGISLILDGLHVKKLFISIVSLLILLTAGILGYKSYQEARSFSLIDIFNQSKVENNEDSTYSTQEDMVISEDKYAGVEKRVIDINIGATETTILDSNEEEYLKIISEYDSNVIKPSLESSQTGEELSILFKLLNERRFYIWRNYNSKFDFLIGKPELPTALYLKLGAGEGIIDLKELILSILDAKVGAGSLS